MGLEGLGGGEGGTTPSVPQLAQTLEDEGTNSQNAVVLNLFLDSANLSVAAPEPISAANTTEPVSSLVFNANFTRERYGKAAVQSEISLATDRKGLLLSASMSSAQKALAFISCLEFPNGLSVMQNNFSDTDVTSRTQPDLDKFNRYPESMFNNAALLNTAKETFVFDAIDASADATTAFTSFQ